MVCFVAREPRQFVSDENGEFKSVDLVEIRCKSTDEKPTEGIASGSTCIVTDTREVFFFDGETRQWI